MSRSGKGSSRPFSTKGVNMQGKSIYTTLAIALVTVIMAGCATLPTDFERPVTHVLNDTANTGLGRTAHLKREEHPGKSGFHLLGNGLDAFVARAVLCKRAERSLDVQYYLYHNDLVGRLFTNELLKAADRGVRVRLLVDDMDLADRDRGVAALDRHPNIEVRIFNPFSRNAGRVSQLLTRMGSVTRRMHNKSFTADNQFTILGGRNIGDEYFDADREFAFADLDVMAIGPVVAGVSSVFDLYWNDELAYPVSVLLQSESQDFDDLDEMRITLNQFVLDNINSTYLQALRNSRLARDILKNQVDFQWGDGKILFDQPEKLVSDFEETQYHLAPMLKPYWEGVKTDLIIFSPYFVPGKPGTAFLSELPRRGVRVRILTNSLASNDVGLVHAGYKKYRKKLLRSGVELYELNKKLIPKRPKRKKGQKKAASSSLHAKSFVFDRQQVFIGSLNLDPRAVLHNTEIGMILESPAIAQNMAGWFDDNIQRLAFRLELKTADNGYEQLLWHGLEEGEPVTYTQEPHTGFWRRLGIGFMSILPIESQL